ncbi:hypothetical protein NIES267_51880 [Calothrix parasitica NIES-267]|uniref:Uncharacterized protein n=1 Tax=Calothrix parasitica NIES-267 TaxID=1973488 RepID=A0A1Z4LWP8_9CYAN|nr:hypothetical protein NIES267_51880 [Calothrix parasitica NIES-267]
MSENKDKKTIKIETLSPKSQENTINQPCETENNSEIIESEKTQENSKPRRSGITTEIDPRPKIVGGIPPWDDDDDSQKDDEYQPQPPTITAEILIDEEKFNTTPRATGEIPPWDDEEEIKK